MDYKIFESDKDKLNSRSLTKYLSPTIARLHRVADNKEPIVFTVGLCVMKVFKLESKYHLNFLFRNPLSNRGCFVILHHFQKIFNTIADQQHIPVDLF